MKNCSFCSHTEPDDAQYCRNCGQQFHQLIQCPVCKQQEPSDAKFCRKCGNSLTHGFNPFNQDVITASVAPTKPARQNSSNGCLIFLVLFIAVIIIITVIIMIGLTVASPKPTETSTSNTTVLMTSMETTVPEETMTDEDYRIFIKDNIFRFDDIHFEGPDSVGGWEADIDIQNMATEEIKYVYIEIVAVNAVGDIITSDTDFDGDPSVLLSMVGPIAEGEFGGKGTVWSSFFYNSTVADFAFKSITIEYMSGVQLIINNDECNLAIQTYNEENQ